MIDPDVPTMTARLLGGPLAGKSYVFVSGEWPPGADVELHFLLTQGKSGFVRLIERRDDGLTYRLSSDDGDVRYYEHVDD